MLGKTLTVTVALSALLTACSYPGSPRQDEAASPSPAPDRPSVVINQDTTQLERSPISEVVDRVVPSVVNVRVTSFQSGLFGSGKAKGEGSGVIIDKDGVIVTNNHVVAGAVNVKVKLNDAEGSLLDGTVVATDATHDLAVVRVETANLEPITLGSSDGLALGDPVVALGYPLGLGGGPSVTQGIVSGLNRTVTISSEQGAEHLTGLLQTDAAINPGNSGGALVDGAGRLVGINTAAASAASAENIGFAIAIDEALPIIKEIISKPLSDQAWLGVNILSVASSSDAVELGLPNETRGALIVDVIPGGPAAEAGLEQGDVILRVGDTPISSNDDVTQTLTDYRPGDAVPVEFLRDADDKTVDVTLARRPATFATPTPQD
ncbi:trypsin-like peptidase domain-containing protein [soil metagenome]